MFCGPKFLLTDFCTFIRNLMPFCKVKYVVLISRCYPRHGSSVTHLPQSSTQSQQNNDTFDEQRNNEPLGQRNNRLSWPQFCSTSQIPYSNKQRMSPDKQSVRRVINPEEAKVFERATQIVMYVLFWWRLTLVGGGVKCSLRLVAQYAFIYIQTFLYIQDK